MVIRQWLGWMLVASSVWLSATACAEGSAPDLSAEFAAFNKTHHIQGWPRLHGCGYEYAFSGKVVGVVLKVTSNKSAEARWDTMCHVPAKHMLTNWPADLPPGKYVVAVTNADTGNKMVRENYHLRVLGVWGDKPDCLPCIKLALKTMCAQASSQDTGDEACRP